MISAHPHAPQDEAVPLPFSGKESEGLNIFHPKHPASSSQGRDEITKPQMGFSAETAWMGSELGEFSSDEEKKERSVLISQPIRGGGAPGARHISIPLAPTYHSLLNMT